MGDYKLLVKKSGVRELFNLADDPEELHDTARQQPEVAERLHSRIMQLREQNRERMEKNKSLDRGLDLDRKSRETEKQMKALGYLE